MATINLLGGALSGVSGSGSYAGTVGPSINNVFGDYTATATAAGTTTLTVASNRVQAFTGTTTQTCVMPVVSTLVLGSGYEILNLSTGVVTVQSSGLNTIVAMAANSRLILSSNATTGTGAGVWYYSYLPMTSDITGTGSLVRATSPTLVTPILGTPTSGNLVNCTGAGKVVQQVYTQTGAVATGTTILPFDDTIPQNTEGDQYMTLAITPQNTANILRIHVTVFVSHSTAGAHTFTIGLFQDSTASALAAKGYTVASGGFRAIFDVTHHMVAGTTSATTFKVRTGVNLAGTTTFNGWSSGRELGGVIASGINITEYLP